MGGAARQHRHRAELLGGEGQDFRGREPVLFGEDGVDLGRAEEHLQGKGEVGGRPVIVTFPNNIRLFLYAQDRTADCKSSKKRKKLRLMMIEYLFSVVAIQVSIDSYVALVMTWQQI